MTPLMEELGIEEYERLARAWEARWTWWRTMQPLYTTLPDRYLENEDDRVSA